MSRPRFVVQTVSGWLDSGSGGNPRPQLSAHVCDSAYLYEVVGTFRSEERQKTYPASYLGTEEAQRRAHELAARLNRDAA